MKFLIAFLLLLHLPTSAHYLQGAWPPWGSVVPVGGGGSVNWTNVHHGTASKNFTCSATSGSTISCSITPSSVSAGNAVVIASSLYQAGSTTAPSYNSVTGDSSIIHCPASSEVFQLATTEFFGTDCAYVLSATGGTPTYTFEWNLGSSSTILDMDVVAYEYNRGTGTASYDGPATGSYIATNGSCTSCLGPSATFSGSKDVCVQWMASYSTPSAPGSPWNAPNDVDTTNVDGNFAGAVNLSSFAQITWPQTPAAYAGMSAVCLK